MTKEEVIAMLENVLEGGPYAIKGDTVLESLDGWDSLGILSVISALDESHGVILSADAITSANTVDDLVRCVEGAAGA